MLVRKFVCKEHEEIGDLGWEPTFLKGEGFEPSWGFGLSHDILEHKVDNIGGAEGEFMAFGAMIWIRGASGWIYNGRNIMIRSFSDMVESDFADVLSRIVRGDQTLKCPGRTYKLRDYDSWESEMGVLVNKGISYFLQEMQESLNDFWLSKDEIKRRAIGWMRKGFRKAEKYYSKHNLGPCDVAYIFDKITKEVERQGELIEGDTLTIRIDLNTTEVSSFRAFDY